MEARGLFCTSCGTRNAEGARFCMSCGAPMAAPPVATGPAAPDIERKVITALFCDVVGSTELAERLDPEDVDRLLRTYHTMARRRIEAYGGTLEKFIGDAVLGVFGAPAAHEDDPDRAILASLRILDELAASSLELHVRIGIHTGEAVVRVGDDRSAEEGLATGDTLNTAARLQNVAAVDGIAVSDSTYRRTTGAYEWADMGEVSVKGKAQPIQVWQPVAESAQPAAQSEEATPFVGRETDLAALAAAFQRTVAAHSLELVTILAEAGMGKSRLVRELRRQVDAQAPGPIWRKGRCLPYGDGVSFWALGEIVKSHAGILETDDQAAIARKLDIVLPEAEDPVVRTWLRERLAPLVGLVTTTAPGTQQETFSAWRRFLESLAAEGPVVLVIEDLHWADEDFVTFLVDLADNAPAVPLLLLVTARPEVAARHPGWLERSRRSTLVQLTSLGDAAIEALVSSTIAAESPDVVQLVLERAAGSPLYAEQLVAHLRERALSTTDGALDARVIPPTIQALLSARIDALPRQLKPALLDASVIGRVFWRGAVATLTREPEERVETWLSDFVRRELTRPVEPSTMVGEAEYAFWHALLRDVAYSFLPRSARLAKHRAAAAWITAELGGSLGDVAEIVADHLQRALELAEATASTEDVPAIRADLASTLIAAADHAMRVGPTRAVSQLEKALQLLSEEDPRRGDVLVALGRALSAASEAPRAAAAFETAQTWRRAHGDPVGAAEIAALRAIALVHAGDFEGSVTVLAHARPILVAAPGQGLVDLLSEEALTHKDMHEWEACLARAEEAIELARRLGLPPPQRALIAKGTTLLWAGDRSGEAAVRTAIDVATAAGEMRNALVGFAGLASVLVQIAPSSDVLAVYDEGLAFAARYGLGGMEIRAQRLQALINAGRVEDVLREAPGLREWAEAHGNAWTAFVAENMLAAGHLIRGDGTPIPASLLSRAEMLGMQAPSVHGAMATDARLRGDRVNALVHLTKAVDGNPDGEFELAVDLVSEAVALGAIDLARRAIRGPLPSEETVSRYVATTAVARLAEAEGDPSAARAGYEAAIPWFTALEWPWYLAFALAGAGRCDLVLGDHDRAVARLGEARELALGMQARPLLDGIEPALSAAVG